MARIKRNLGTIEVNGVEFLHIQGEHTIDSIKLENRPYAHYEKRFDELYAHPSQYKKDIWEYWDRFFAELGIWDIHCQGNTMTFTITAYDHKNGNIFYITKGYNRLYAPKEGVV